MAQDSGEKKAKPKATPDKTRPQVRKLPAPAEASLRPGYRISYGDVIDIMVWKEPDASVSGVTIRGDGKINPPFLKGSCAPTGFVPSCKPGGSGL